MQETIPSELKSSLEDIQKNPEFQARHQDDLSATAFGKEMAIGFLPTVAGLAAGYVGFRWLAPQLRSLKFIKRTELIGAIGGKIYNSKPEEIVAQLGTVMEDLAPKFSAIPKEELGGATILRVVKDHASVEQLEALGKKLGITEIKPSDGVKWAAAFGTGLVGMIATAIPLGFRNWKKEESARLGAVELGENISKLEVFKPSDTELVQENQRLRTMLSEKHAQHTSAPAQDVPSSKVSGVHHEQHVHHRSEAQARA